MTSVLENETPQETYTRLIANAETVLDRVQIALAFNQENVSARCAQYQLDYQAWHWRQDRYGQMSYRV